MPTFETFKDNAIERNLCSDYIDALRECKSDKLKLFELSLIPQSIPYIATSIYEGWGMDIEYIKNEYKDLLNGKYIVSKLDEITDVSASFHLCNSEEISIFEDISHICSCTTEVVIPNRKHVKLYVSNKSDIRLVLGEFSSVAIYLFDESKIKLIYAPNTAKLRCYRYSDKSELNNSVEGFNTLVFNKILKI